MLYDQLIGDALTPIVMPENPTHLMVQAAAEEVTKAMTDPAVGPAVDPTYQLVLQITNCVLFGVVVAMNASSQYFMTYSLR